MSDQETLPTSTNRRQMIIGAAAAFGGLALFSTDGRAAEEEAVRPAKAIHQEPVFKASRKRVYDALTKTRQFEKIIEISGVLKAMKIGTKPAAISREVGGTFTIFGGHIVGRHIELVPGVRIVQAWRVGNWDPGVYSIANFELVEQDGGTRIVFDHTGFPSDEAQHLADGWTAHYWEPMGKYLA
jgi:uncharacterized protein YndB with AHSA1/START domain